MSTVAYARGTIAADTRATNQHLTFNAPTPKIAIDGNGNLYGVVGNYVDVCKVVKAVNKQRKFGGVVELPIPGKDDRYEMLVVFTDGRISRLTPDGEENFDGEIYIAIGSGAAVAYGALYAGATPEIAVGAAIEHIEGTGGRVQSIRSPQIVEHLSRHGHPVTKPSSDAADAMDYMFRARQLSSNAEHRASKNEPLAKPAALALEPETPEQEFDRIARESK